MAGVWLLPGDIHTAGVRHPKLVPALHAAGPYFCSLPVVASQFHTAVSLVATVDSAYALAVQVRLLRSTPRAQCSLLC
jgi:hypothetical protein